MEDIKSQFIIKISHPEYFDGIGYAYLQKIGNEAWQITFTNDIYKAKAYPSKNTAIKTAERIKKYIKEAHDNGWSTYGYDWIPSSSNPVECGMYGKILEFVDTEVLEVKLTIIK